MSSFRTFNGYEVEDAYARKSVGELGKITPGIGMVDGTGVTITDSSKGVAIEFDVKGRSTQDGEPTPDNSITPKSVGDMGYFDGELLGGIYTNGVFDSITNYVCSKNRIPCQPNDNIEITYDGDCNVVYAFFYDENGAYLSHKDITSNKLTTQAIANAYSFHIGVYNANGLTVATVKHICVTINDKYALIVDSVGKNELNNTATTQTINGVTFKVNEDKSITVNGTATANAELVIGSFNAEVDSYVLNGCPNGAVNYGIRLYDGVIHKASDTGNSVTYEVTTETTLKSTIFIGSGVTLSNAKFYPMIRLASVTDSTYEPYKKSRKYIPISAPLRGLGEVTDVASLSECEVERKFAEVIFDGSSDEIWRYFNTYDNYYNVSLSISNIAKTTNAVCSHFKNTDILNAVPESGKFTINANRFVTFGFSADIATTLDEWLTWLQANPITVIYELAESTTESIEPTDVDTFEGVTQISVSDNAGCKVSYYRNNEDGKKMQELDNRMVTAEDTINNLESNAVTVAGDIEDIKTSLSENPLLVTLAPTDELPTIVAGSTVGSFKDTWLNRVINDYEYLIIVIRHRNGSKQIVQIPSMLIEIGGTYTFPFNDVQNNINGAYITINSATRYGIGIFGTLPNDISFELYKYGKPISVG